jgi:hypothetical protein
MLDADRQIGGLGGGAATDREGEAFVDGECLQPNLHDGWGDLMKSVVKPIRIGESGTMGLPRHSTRS